MKILAMPIGFGAFVEEINLRQIGESDAGKLREALLEYGLLVVRDQGLAPDEQVSASRIFGSLETFPNTGNQVAGVPQIFRVASRPADGHVEVGRYWHSDGSFREVATPITLWQTVEEAREGGQTLFTDLQLAYRELSLEMKRKVEKLITVHRNGILHPLVMLHPKTGRPGLYLNMGLTHHIQGLREGESEELMAELDQHFSRPGATYIHAWQKGDFVIADNLRVAHKATSVSADQRRILNRTTVSGNDVFWNKVDGREKLVA